MGEGTVSGHQGRPATVGHDADDPSVLSLDHQLSSAERVIFFSDAVFAIAMTLLVLDLKLPELGENVTREGVEAALVARMPNLISFMLSFAIIAMLWYTHHGRFETVEKIDGGGVKLSLVLLFFVALLPMPTALVMQPTAHSPWPVILYGANVAAAYLSLNLLSRHLHRERLDGLSDAVYRARQLVTSPVWIIFLLSLPFAFIDSRVPYLFWMALAPVEIIVTRVVERRLRAEHVARG